MLAIKVLEDSHHAHINLKRIAIGNGDFNTNIKYSTRLGFAFNHALIDTSSWNKAIDYCCGNNSFGCDFLKSKNSNQKNYVQNILNTFQSVFFVFHSFVNYCPN
jgi:hypothetical protein